MFKAGLECQYIRAHTQWKLSKISYITFANFPSYQEKNNNNKNTQTEKEKQNNVHNTKFHYEYPETFNVVYKIC